VQVDLRWRNSLCGASLLSWEKMVSQQASRSAALAFQVVTHFESSSAAIPSMSQTWSETPASIAGVTLSVR